jgi:hypothetical protein
MSLRYQAGILTASYAPLKVPDSPTIGSATGGNATASVTFTAPSNPGASAITGYTATSTPSSITGTGSASPVTVTGLANGTSYTFVVLAVNTYGSSAPSAASNSVTPVAPPSWILVYYGAGAAAGAAGNNGIYLSAGQVINPLGVLATSGGLQTYSTITINAAGTITAQTAASYSTDQGVQLAPGARCFYDATNNYLYFCQKTASQWGPVKFRPSTNTNGFNRTWRITFDNSQRSELNCVVADSSQNSYWAGNFTRDNCGDTAYAYLVKYDSGGTFQWSAGRYAGGSGTGAGWTGVTLDASSQPVVVGNVQVNGQQTIYALIAKYDTSGSLLWQTKLTYTATQQRAYYLSVDKDTSYNYYASGYTYGNALGLIAKYNDSGTLQWQRSIAVSGRDVYIRKVRVDSSNNVFYLGSTSAANEPCYLFKYDSSGTLQWQRSITATWNLATGNCDFVIDETDGRLIINFATASEPSLTSNGMMMVIKYPTDGSITGTYAIGSGSIVIAAGVATDASSSYTNATGTSTVFSGAQSNSNIGNLSGTTVSKSSSLVNINP